MTDFTPNTELVRNIYVEAAGGFGADLANAEFTRWLVAHDAQIAADAWDESVEALERAADGPCWSNGVPDNPYRTESEGKAP